MILEIIFFSPFRKITVGGFVNQLIKKFWPNKHLKKLAPDMSCPAILSMDISSFENNVK